MIFTMFLRKPMMQASSVADQAKNHEKITVLTNTVMEEVSGETVFCLVQKHRHR